MNEKPWTVEVASNGTTILVGLKRFGRTGLNIGFSTEKEGWEGEVKTAVEAYQKMADEKNDAEQRAKEFAEIMKKSLAPPKDPPDPGSPGPARPRPVKPSPVRPTFQKKRNVWDRLLGSPTQTGGPR